MEHDWCLVGICSTCDTLTDPSPIGCSDEDHVTNDEEHFGQMSRTGCYVFTICEATIILKSLQVYYVAKFAPSRRKRSSEEVLVAWLETSVGLADAAEKGGWERSFDERVNSLQQVWCHGIACGKRLHLWGCAACLPVRNESGTRVDWA